MYRSEKIKLRAQTGFQKTIGMKNLIFKYKPFITYEGLMLSEIEVWLEHSKYPDMIFIITSGCNKD